MKETSILIDTDILIEILRNNEPVFSRFNKFCKSGGIISISCITYYECKRGFLILNSQKRLKVFDKFIENVEIIYLTDEIIDYASKMYAKITKSGKFPGEFDLLIASTALFKNRTISTHNLKHYLIFKELFGLKFDDWNSK